MDFDTAILFVMTACAYFWFISFGIREERKAIKAREREELAYLKRQERLRRLFDR